MNIMITDSVGMVGFHAAEYFAQSGHGVLVCDKLMRFHIFGSEWMAARKVYN